MKIGILAVQGAFEEHKKMLSHWSVDCLELRNRADVFRGLDGLILPGGESTVQGKLLRELNMKQPLLDMIKEGLPVLGTCTGLILLAERLSNDPASYFSTLPVTVRRNAYGRQLGSFHTVAEFGGKSIPMTFIRAPYIEKVAPEAEVLSEVEGRIVAVRYQNQLGLSFHPELDSDLTVHQMFLDICNAYKKES